MHRVLTTEQVREVELRAAAAQGISPRQLMLTAGTALAEAVQFELAEIEAERADAEERMEFDGHGGLRTSITSISAGDRRTGGRGRAPRPRVVVVCGPGNNGGDGWAAAWALHRRGVPVTVYTVVEPSAVQGTAADIAYEAVSAGVPWLYRETPDGPNPFAHAALVVDALLGIGASLPLREPIRSWAEAINRAGLPVIAADIPTGIDADTGEADGAAVVAARTVTFIAPKLGTVFAPGALHAGVTDIIDLGIAPQLIGEYRTAPELYSDRELGRGIPLPQYHHNKFTRGRLLIVAGSPAYTGAAVLAAHAAGRSGAGYVTVAAPVSVVPTLQTHLLTAPVVGLPVSRDGSLSPRAAGPLRDLAATADAVLIGPGLDRAPATIQLVRDLVVAISAENAASPAYAKPILLDADGLNAFAGAAHLLRDHVGPLVLTPHAGELARLVESTGDLIAADPLAAAGILAGDGRTVVLKGSTTVVDSGRYRSLDSSASPALATAGTGDVLAGTVGALLCQRVDPYLAACIGVRIQARASVIAAEELTPVSVTALDVVDYIPFAVADLLDAAVEEDRA